MALAIAGSVSVVKGKGLNADAWEELFKILKNNAAKKRRVRGDQAASLSMVLGTSFDSLSERKQEELLKTAVLAPGAVAPIEMLLSLWDIRVCFSSIQFFHHSLSPPRNLREVDHRSVGCAVLYSIPRLAADIAALNTALCYNCVYFFPYNHTGVCLALIKPRAVLQYPVLPSQDMEGTREEAEGIVNKCLLQDVGGGGYRLHDLVLEFVKVRIKAEEDILRTATQRQAQYLGRLDVVKEYKQQAHVAGVRGFLLLAALWRSVEQLSGDCGLEAAAYRTSLAKLNSREPSTDVASCLCSIGDLFNLQVTFA